MTTVRQAVVVASAAALACAVGLWSEPRTMLAAYLPAAVATVSIPIGALGVLLFGYLVPGRWADDLFSPLSRAVSLLPLSGILMLPVLIGLAALYPWVHEPPKGMFQLAYLNPWFFATRSVSYFIILSAIAFRVVRAHGHPDRMTVAGAGGMIVYALVVSLAGIDWLESIEPHFHSSIYGLLFLVATVLAGMALGMVLVLRGRHRAPVLVYGGILLSLLLCWAYNHAMQYIIIWSGNLPDEMIWYVERLRGGWGPALWALYLLQFVVPFGLLLSERIRGRARPLLFLAAGTLALRYLEMIVLVVPALPVSSWLLLIDIPAATVLTGALAVVAWLSLAEQTVRLVGVVPTKRERRSLRQGRAR